MTKDEILVMEAGPELNALIAQDVMGWQKDGTYRLGPAWVKKTIWRYKDGRTVDNIWTLATYVNNWLPSTNIATAWKVLERLMDYWLPSVFHDGQLWVCELNNLQRKVVASAIIAPHAVSIAALLTVMEVKE